MNEPIEKMALDKHHLIQSVSDAQLLLRYAIKKGIDIEHDTIQTIIEAHQLIEVDKWQLEFEVKFWEAFKILAQKTAPVSVASLKATKGDYIPETNPLFRFFRQYKDPIAIGMVKLYGRMTIIFMLFMLSIQIYAVIGSSLITDIENSDKQMIELMRKSDQEVSTKSKNQNTANSFDSFNLNMLITSKDTGLRLLEKWEFISSFDEKHSHDLRKCIGDYAIDCINKATQHYVKSSKFILTTLYSYILPLLYGLLGSLAYILRTLAAEIKNLTYTSESNIHYFLRLHLGTLAGLAIGWFFYGNAPTAGLSTTTLSPLALSFLAGYSVEILFSSMDKIVSAFSDRGSSKTSA